LNCKDVSSASCLTLGLDKPTLKLVSRQHVLSPIDRYIEILFGIIMTLSITGTLSVVESGGGNLRTMLWTVVGCNLAWGFIDALFYIIARVAERSRTRYLQAQSKAGESILTPIVNADDFLGALAVFLVVLLPTIPLAIPFLFPLDTRVALRVSNGLAIVMLYLAGNRLGKYAGTSAVIFGLATVGVGALLVAVVVLLGG
jgi:hypothetical protein